MPEMPWWYDMGCWNGLSPQQQRWLIEDGVLPFGHWRAAGHDCPNGAQVAIECQDDASPGPRFYCLPCARIYLTQKGLS